MWTEDEAAVHSNGCTNSPDFGFKRCCVRHDFDYYRGGSEKDRLHADQALQSCIRNNANQKCPFSVAFHWWLSYLYYAAVRLFGRKHFNYRKGVTVPDNDDGECPHCHEDIAEMKAEKRMKPQRIEWWKIWVPIIFLLLSSGVASYLSFHYLPRGEAESTYVRKDVVDQKLITISLSLEELIQKTRNIDQTLGVLRDGYARLETKVEMSQEREGRLP